MSRVIVVDVDGGNLFASTDTSHSVGDQYETYLTGHGKIEGNVRDTVTLDVDDVTDEDLEEVLKSQNHTLDDFTSDSSTCASCGVDEDLAWSVPEDSPVGRCLDLDADSEVCDECFQEHSNVYCVRGDAL